MSAPEDAGIAPTSAASTPDAGSSGPWSPLRHGLFRSLWIATIVSNIGTWMQDVGAGWLMTSLTASPLLVALVEAADSIPVMLLAMPAGALADIVDRRRLLLVTQLYLMLVAGALAVVTLLSITTPWMLLGFIFLLGIGTALTMPAWGAIVPDVVPREELSPAVALNSVAINVSRAIGPAVAGALVAAVGAWLVFLLNAASYIAIIAVLRHWKREHTRSSLPAERFVTAIRVGFRFIAHTRALEYVLVRGLAFFVFASATWALFPLIVRRELGRGPEVYGFLLTCIGVGAVAGAMVLPRVRARLSRDTLVAGASVLYALAALALAHVHNLALLAVAMLATGVAWISTVSSLQVAAQMMLPEWVRARGLAAFVVVLMGGMAAGSVVWGQVATHVGIPAALTLAAGGMVAAIALTWRFKLGAHEVLDFAPSMDWPAPVVAKAPLPDAGPVMVTIEYRIDPARREAFVEAMEAVSEMRRRNGAYFWELFDDTEQPSRFVECFMDESWLEHLRMHERMSIADRATLERARVFLAAGEATHSRHWVGARPQ